MPGVKGVRADLANLPLDLGWGQLTKLWVDVACWCKKLGERMFSYEFTLMYETKRASFPGRIPFVALFSAPKRLL